MILADLSAGDALKVGALLAVAYAVLDLLLHLGPTRGGKKRD